VNGFLATVPAYFSQEVISPDRNEATLAFGLKLMPLSRQQRIIEAMRSALKPPSGVQATLVGLPVLAAAADAQVASSGQRTLQLLLSLAVVAFVLLISFKGDAGARAACASCACVRLVGAAAVDRPTAAQPDVSDAWRARRGDLHRVQRPDL
jgi:hypothetical protein